MPEQPELGRCPIQPQCRVAQSIGLVEGIQNLVSELNGVESLVQRTAADTLGVSTPPPPEATGLKSAFKGKAQGEGKEGASPGRASPPTDRSAPRE
jgi:hypothetical protein